MRPVLVIETWELTTLGWATMSHVCTKFRENLLSGSNVQTGEHAQRACWFHKPTSLMLRKENGPRKNGVRESLAFGPRKLIASACHLRAVATNDAVNLVPDPQKYALKAVILMKVRLFLHRIKCYGVAYSNLMLNISRKMCPLSTGGKVILLFFFLCYGSRKA